MNLSMYSGFSDIVKNEGIEATAKTAQRLGFNTVEFIDMQSRDNIIPDVKTAREYKKVLAEHGLTVACFSFGISVINPAEPDYPTEDAVNRLLFSAEMAAEVGSPYFHHTLILSLSCDKSRYDNNFASVTERLLPHVCRVADRCAELGITALYEPQGFYVNGKDRFPEFYRAVKTKCRNVGVCGDIGNPYFCDWRGEDFVSEMASEIRHVHLKDYKLYTSDTLPEGAKAYTSMNGIKLLPVLMGKGDIDIAYCIDRLTQSGYTGAYAFESEYRSAEEIALDVAYIKSLIKN